VRRGVEASHAEVQGTEAGLRDAQVIVTAEVARTYFELRGLQTQLAVARRNVDNQQETLQLTTVRLDAGRGTELDTTRAQAQLSATLATVVLWTPPQTRAIYRLSGPHGSRAAGIDGCAGSNEGPPALPVFVAVGDPIKPAAPPAGLRIASATRRPDARLAWRL